MTDQDKVWPDTGTVRHTQGTGPADGDQAAPDQRSAMRFSLLIRQAKLLTTKGEYLCVLRDVAPGGCKVRLFHPLPQVARRMTLELANGDRYEVEQIWERDGQAGFSFPAPVPVEYLINEASKYPKRAVRAKVSVRAVLSAGGVKAEVSVRDLSQQGARIESDAYLARDQRVRLELPGMAEIDAKVRWRRDGALGLVFEQTFRFEDLARFVASAGSSESRGDQNRDDGQAVSAG